MGDSHSRAVLAIGSDEILRKNYVNFMGFIRFGMILEDLDTFAVWLSYKHNQGAATMDTTPTHHPMCLVTACVDRIDLRHDAIIADSDVVLEGHVSWSGRSSLETTMNLLQRPSPSQDWATVLQAKFVMVALHPRENRSVPVFPLEPKTEEEKAIFAEGQESKNIRQKQATVSLLKIAPSEGEGVVLHNLFRQTIDKDSHTFRQRVLPQGHVWMEDSKLKNVIICFPQQQNLYDKIFGGFLMRSAFELAWANASVFCRSRPVTLAVDDIMFRKSVDIGSLLFLSSEVCYTSGPFMQVRVHAEVVKPQDGTQETTNTFHFTFATPDRSPVPGVVPKTYSDGMLYLSGRRHLEESLKMQT